MVSLYDPLQPPEPPPMRVVTKGWFTSREEHVSSSVLAASDNEKERDRRGQAEPVVAPPSPPTPPTPPPPDWHTKLDQPVRRPKTDE